MASCRIQESKKDSGLVTKGNQAILSLVINLMDELMR